MASSSIDEMVRWGAANGISLDPNKTEVMHFSHSKLRTAPATRHGDVEKFPDSALRWLGIWLDSRLSFRIHVEKWAGKAHAVTYHLRGLANTIRGPLPSAILVPRYCQTKMEQAYQRHTIWQSASHTKNEQGFTPVHGAILPVWKTTPIAILHRESGIPPVDQLLGKRRWRFSARLKSLDDAHPLVRRTLPIHQPTYHDLIKRRGPKLLQKRFQQEEMPLLQTAPKEKTAKAFLHWVKSLDPLTLVVYSD
ncbi:reverse transcriptase [Fusarium mundagurra]|uniref:Reverse transcriptase n=1 Tax=Fusarium mundagurra TaxID=1567541 RepID=A0A8H6DED5_9HYPO|nr:reverse transcriptase [Fusarium mundagurra]